MSGQPTESQSPSEQATGESPAVRFTLHGLCDEYDIHVQDPTHALKYANSRADSPHHSRKYNCQLFHKDIFARDAMTNGWLVPSPFDFSVTENDGSYDLSVPSQPEDADIVYLDDLSGENVVVVNTLWNVEFPDGYKGLLTGPFIDDQVPPHVIPQEVSTPDGSAEAVTLYLVADTEFRVVEGQPLTQLHPLSESMPVASHRVATEAEEDDISKERRRRSIYPNSYSERRDGNRWGGVQLTE